MQDMSVSAPASGLTCYWPSLLRGWLPINLIWALIIQLIADGCPCAGISVADTDRLWWKVLQCPPLPVTGVLLHARHLQRLDLVVAALRLLGVAGACSMTSRTSLQGFPIPAKSPFADTPSLIPRSSCWSCLMPLRISGGPTSECDSQTHMRWVARGSGQQLLLHSQCLPASCPNNLHAQPPCLPAGSGTTHL